MNTILASTSLLPVQNELEKKDEHNAVKERLKDKISVEMMKQRSVERCFSLVMKNGPSTNAERNSAFQIFIKDLYCSTVALQINQLDDIMTIKKHIQQNMGIPSVFQRLTYQGKLLEDNVSISKYKILSGSTVHLCLGLLGGTGYSDSKNTPEELSDMWLSAMQERIGWKTKLITTKNCVLMELKIDKNSTERKKYALVYKETIINFQDLISKGEKEKRSTDVQNLLLEKSRIEDDYNCFQKLIERKLMAKKDCFVSGVSRTLPEIERKFDMFKKINFPVFSGKTEDFEEWRAAFNVLIENSDAAEIEKILYLQQSLRNEAFQMVFKLGFVTGAYNLALERLERRYGKNDIVYQSLMTKPDSIPLINYGKVGEIELFLQWLDQIIMRLMNSKYNSSLEQRALIQYCLRKLPVIMLEKWEEKSLKIQNNAIKSILESLQEWLRTEAQFLQKTEESLAPNIRSIKNKSAKPVKVL